MKCEGTFIIALFLASWSGYAQPSLGWEIQGVSWLSNLFGHSVHIGLKMLVGLGEEIGRNKLKIPAL